MSTPILRDESIQIHLGDKYEMKRLLATGGAARIYLARQIGLDRDVVVKVLRQQLGAKPEFRKHFTLEAKLLARLEHPNIVQVIDVGEQDGFFYFVMEYVRGGSLRNLLERVERLPLDVALSIAHFILRGVTYVHERKVLHLDLKPANILLSNESVIKVADFGLARLINQGEANAGSQPKAGTPLYMSPEQVLGAKLDERSDIFSLGVLIYQLLAGKTPFTGHSADEVYLKILACRVTPSTAHRPEIPDFIDNLVLGCLQRDRSQRHPNVRVLFDEFDSAIKQLGIHRPEERVSKYLLDPDQYRTVVKKPRAARPAPVARPAPALPRPSRPFPGWLRTLLISLMALGLLALEVLIRSRSL